MRTFLTLVRRELGAFFVSLTGYVIIASVLLLLGFSFTDMLAKFTGTLLFYMLTWLPLFGCIAVVRYFTREPTVLDPWTTASTFFGIMLIGCLYMSIGCFASALTRSQIIAAMNSFVIGLGLFVLSLRKLVPAPSADWAAKVFSYISLSEHMEDFVRGFVDTRHIVFYLSLTVVFLFLTLKAVESRRWK